MSEGFIVRALRCGHCGSELPVMSQFVTFQCATCFRYWILTPRGLEPITVYRAAPPEESEVEPILLPFWVIELNRTSFRENVQRVTEDLQSTKREIVSSKLQIEDGEMEGLIMQNPDLDPGLVKSYILSEASQMSRMPTATDISILFKRVVEQGRFCVYVPAFPSPNTYAYLKVGRLLTRLQPTYRVEKSQGHGCPVLCALQADEAISLMDFVFISTLPESIQVSGDFLKRIHLEPSGSPRLIEFPFERRGSSLMSLIGEFFISGRLVDGFDKQNRAGSISKK